MQDIVLLTASACLAFEHARFVAVFGTLIQFPSARALNRQANNNPQHAIAFLRKREQDSSHATTILVFQWKQIARAGVPVEAFVFTLALLIAILATAGRFNDPDMWWHLRLGQLIWLHHWPPTRDTLSYTAAGRSTIPHEWLSELTIYLSYLFAGYRGMMAWLCTGAACIYAVAIHLAYRVNKSLPAAAAACIVACACSTVSLAVRPHMLGYAFLSLELLVLEHRGRSRHCLPLLFLFWVNSHGSFSFGLFVAAVYLLPERKWKLLAACIISCLITPVGYRQLLYPLDTLVHQNESMASISEWQHLGTADVRFWFVLAVLAALATGWRKLRLQDIVLLTASAYLAFEHARFVAVFGIVAASPLGRAFVTGPQPSPARVWWPVPALLFTTALIQFPSATALNGQANNNPQHAIAFLRAHAPAGHLLNEYVFGGYLLWALPEQKVFIDGRGDIYDWSGILAEYNDWRLLRTDTSALLRKYDIGACMLWRGSPIEQRINQMPDWKLIEIDGPAALYYAEGPATRTPHHSPRHISHP